MNKVVVWIVDKILTLSLVFIVLVSGLFIYQELTSTAKGYAYFVLDKNFKSNVFEIKDEYAQPSKEADYVLSPTSADFAYSGPGANGWLVFLELTPMVIIFFLVYNLWQLVGDVKRGEFFNKKSVIYLRRIAGSLIFMELFEFAEEMIGGFYFNSVVLGFERRSSFSISFIPNLSSYFFVGLLVLIIAEAFAHGLKLKEEQDLTI